MSASGTSVPQPLAEVEQPNLLCPAAMRNYNLETTKQEIGWIARFAMRHGEFQNAHRLSC